MCTIIIAKNVFLGKPIVVAANRDELLDRASEMPKIHNKGILAPKDLIRGGFWVGVNKFGLFVGLTNRLSVKSVSGKDSRGKLVSDALNCQSAKEAFNYLSNLSANKFNGFYMVLADRDDFFYIGGDGVKLETSEEKDGILVITNHGVGREISEDTSRRVCNAILGCLPFTIGNNNIDYIESLKDLLNTHDTERYGICINDPENNYGTKSSCIIQLDHDHWDYWHRERNGDAHICKEPFILQQTLKIELMGNDFKVGSLVRMSDNLKQMLIAGGSDDHLHEFGDCIGRIESFLDLNSSGEKNISNIGPEVEVRWYPSNFHHAYDPSDLDADFDLSDRRNFVIKCSQSECDFGIKLFAPYHGIGLYGIEGEGDDWETNLAFSDKVQDCIFRGFHNLKIPIPIGGISIELEILEGDVDFTELTSFVENTISNYLIKRPFLNR